MKSLIKKMVCPLLITLFVSAMINPATAQKGLSGAELQKEVESGHFTYVANSVLPLRGRTRFLSPGNIVMLSKDTLVSDLPYFGVADQPPLSTDEAGIKFTSTKFDYSYSAKGKGGWDVQVSLKDQTNARQFRFTIFDNGDAVLDVTSNFRDPISFKGYIR